MVGPNSHSVHMFKMRCSQPPCRNIIEKKGRISMAANSVPDEKVV
jgi:hypothetical protein